MKRRLPAIVVIIYSLVLVQFIISNFFIIIGPNYSLKQPLADFVSYQIAHPLVINCGFKPVAKVVPRLILPQKTGKIGFPFAASVQQSGLTCKTLKIYHDYYFLPFNESSLLNAGYIFLVSLIALIIYRISGGQFKRRNLWYLFLIVFTLMELSEVSLGTSAGSASLVYFAASFLAVAYVIIILSSPLKTVTAKISRH